MHGRVLLKPHIHTERFIMYPGVTKIYDRKTVGHLFTKPVQIEGTTQFPTPNPTPRKLFFIVVHISAVRRCECVYKTIDVPLLTRVWQELEYRIDVCRVTRGAHIEHL
jgi:hypothetical protein